MNCKDVRDYLEDMGNTRRPLPEKLAEHARSCAECARSVQDHQVVAKSVQLIRGRVPGFPESLDAAVMSDFRRFLDEHAAATNRPIHRAVASYISIAGHHWRLGLTTALPWAAALAFAAMVGYGAIVFFVPHRPSEWTNEQNVPPVKPSVVATKKDVPAAKVNRSARRVHPPRTQRHDVEKAAYGRDSLPRTFQSLIYCDPISCPGAMDVIRVQLPAPVLGLTQASVQPDGMVAADVLVGADGIARGIRVVE